jgi:hypothetical protein
MHVTYHDGGGGGGEDRRVPDEPGPRGGRLLLWGAEAGDDAARHGEAGRHSYETTPRSCRLLIRARSRVPTRRRRGVRVRLASAAGSGPLGASSASFPS